MAIIRDDNLARRLAAAEYIVSIAILVNKGGLPMVSVLQTTPDRGPEFLATFPYIRDFTEPLVSEIETAAFSALEARILHQFGIQTLLGS